MSGSEQEAGPAVLAEILIRRPTDYYSDTCQPELHPGNKKGGPLPPLTNTRFLCN